MQFSFCTASVTFIARLVNRFALTKINSVTVGTEETPVESCAEAAARGSIEDEQALLAVALWNSTVVV